MKTVWLQKVTQEWITTPSAQMATKWFRALPHNHLCKPLVESHRNFEVVCWIYWGKKWRGQGKGRFCKFPFVGMYRTLPCARQVFSLLARSRNFSTFFHCLFRNQTKKKSPEDTSIGTDYFQSKRLNRMVTTSFEDTYHFLCSIKKNFVHSPSL